MRREVPYFDKLLGGGEAADAERQQDPPSGVAALGRILSELFADLTVDLVPVTEEHQQLNKAGLKWRRAAAALKLRAIS